MKGWLSASAAVVVVLAAAPVASGDVNVISDDAAGVAQTESPRRQQPEPSLAIDPRNTNVIVAGAQDFRRARELQAACGGDRWNGFYRSTDGGATWSHALVPGRSTTRRRVPAARRISPASS